MKISTNSIYLSDDTQLETVMELTGLSLDELESLVGRFNKGSVRAGQLRGELVTYIDDTVEIRHHFTKKTLYKTS